MILGTAQLGLDYGIHNTTGKPDREAAFHILDYAWRHGVDILDTAGAYGDSESIIGDYQEMSHHRFRICTKSVSGTAEELAGELEKSIRTLKCEQIWLYYLHRYDSCKNDGVIRELERQKAQGRIAHVGISIYEPEELEHILATLSGAVDVVQIPFNLLDYARWQEKNLLQRAKEKGILIFGRSIFLQGLFFHAPDSEKVLALSASKALKELRVIAKECSMSMQQLAVSFVMGQPYIDEILLGCETVEQLSQNIALTEWADGKKLPGKIIQRLAEISAKVHDNVTDPRKWNA